MFSDGQQETGDLPWSGKAHKERCLSKVVTVVKDVTVKMIIDLDTTIKENRHRNVRDVANEFGVSISSILNWFHDQATSFLADGIRNLPQQWEARLNAMGDFF
ncbi:hypothetical protein TNCV_2118741 [Trichonephila clavipes]|nr:hypothetical protein TNCV_2118741 [Trichonephila clavipes]